MPETTQKTAMMQLRDRLQELGNDSLLHEKYTLAFRDILHIIDTELLAVEKQTMKNLFEGIAQNVGTVIRQSDLPTFEEYYLNTFNTK